MAEDYVFLDLLKRAKKALITLVGEEPKDEDVKILFEDIESLLQREDPFRQTVTRIDASFMNKPGDKDLEDVDMDDFADFEEENPKVSKGGIILP